MLELIEKAMDTGNMSLVVAICAVAVAYYLYKKSETTTNERLTELKEDNEKLLAENKADRESFLETLNKITSEVVTKLDTILDCFEELGVDPDNKGGEE